MHRVTLVAPTPYEGIQRAEEFVQQYLRHKYSQEARHSFKFSWLRCLVSFASYVFFLTDVIRAGLGQRGLTPGAALEPGFIPSYGPYRYMAAHLTIANATKEASIPYWPYKYDTTSISMRSVARHLGIAAWSPCVLYDTECDESLGLPRASVFLMIDSLVDGVRDCQSMRTSPDGRHLVLRTRYDWYDRLYHYVLPAFFQKKQLQSHHAHYYGRNHLHPSLSSFCGRETLRPYSCDESWTQIYRFARSVKYKRETMWTNIERRVRWLQTAYPNRTTELLVLTASDDYRQGGYVLQGSKPSDIVALTRIRDCPPESALPCTTVAVDDYRQEGGIMATNAASWFPVVASLRLVGQTYAWARLVLLLTGCYYAQLHDSRLKDTSLWRRWLMVLRTVFLIPSQVVVYGSLIPIACYTLAHVVDSPDSYMRLIYLFVSPLGTLKLTATQMLLVSTVAMRSVWVVASVYHIALAVYTRRSWSPLKGVPGTPEFLIVLLATANIVAEVRLLSLRNCKVISIDEVVPSQSRLILQSMRHDLTRGVLANFLIGITLDARTVSCSVLFVLTGVLVLRSIAFTCPRLVPFRVRMLSRTLVPYSAGSLWLSNTLAVNWHGMLATQTRPRSENVSPKDTTVYDCEREDNRRATRHELSLGMTETPLAGHLHNEMAEVGTRRADVDAMIFLINLAVMTDPLTFLQLRVFKGHQLGIYDYKPTGRPILLPFACAASDSDTGIDWRDFDLCAVVSTKEIEWRALLHCA